MSSPTPSYIPYTPKRHSTQTSIASLSQVQSSTSSSSSQSQPPSASSSRAPSHSRTTSSARSDYSPWLKSPQPNRPSLIGVNHQWQSSSSTASSNTTTTQNGRSPLNAPTTQSCHQSQLSTDHNKVSISASSPIPHNTLPFSPSPRPPQSQPSPSPVNGNSSTTTTPHSSSPTKRSRTVVVPYLESFQPVGVRRDRTEQFFEIRRNKRREKLGEEERLERRMDKLLELHFPTSTATTSASSNPTPTSSTFSAFNSLPSLTKSAKDFWKQSTTTTTTTVTTSGGGRNNNKKSSEVVVVVDSPPPSNIKEEEQKLVKWQEDKSIKNCQICKIGFGFLTRKHHCRLCGRIICFLPPTPTTSPSDVFSTPKEEGETKVGLVPISRRERCSTFFTFISNQNPDSDDHQQLQRQGDSNHRGNIRFDDDEAEEEAAEGSEYKEKFNTNTTGGGGGTNFKRRNGLIVEISPPIEEDLTNAKATFDEMMMKATSASTAAAGSGGQQNQKKFSKEKENVNKKDERKKVRICRDCLNIVLRHQLANLPLKTPNWLKLYRVLKTLETEIEQSLIEFQQLANQLQKSHSKEVDQSSTAIRPPSISQTSALRARLLTNLASYDTLSKRLLSLSTSTSTSTSTSSISTGGGSNELDRLQKALGTRSMNWLSEKLSLLRTLGTVEELSGRNASKKAAAASSSSEQEDVGGGGGVKSLESLLNQDELRRVRERIGDVGAAGGEEGTNGKLLRLGKNTEEEKEDGQLGVLLEQEKLVQSYLEDANSRRQFEDAASLQASLDELRGEIQKLRLE